MIIDVIIPVYRPDKRLAELLKRLHAQTHPIRKIVLINSIDPGRPFPRAEYERSFPLVKVQEILREEFDHGGTRDEWVRRSDADVVVFFSQDALPADRCLIERLSAPFKDGQVAAVYGRHITDSGCDEIERYTRRFNYPAQSRVKSKEDENQLGIKTYFCSNVCAAYKRSWYLKAGGFERHIIAAEDMVLTYRLLSLGADIVYEASARVLHYHTYSIAQQFCRNFDIGVLHKGHEEIFGRLQAGGEGLRLVRQTGAYLIRIGRKRLLLRLFFISAAKYMGYCLGRAYRRLPPNFIERCSRNKQFWKREAQNERE